jgi:hypothetical protein
MKPRDINLGEWEDAKSEARDAMIAAARAPRGMIYPSPSPFALSNQINGPGKPFPTAPVFFSNL